MAPIGRLEKAVVTALVGALVAAHGLWGGAYDTVVRAELGILVWWVLLLGVVVGVLPRARLGRSGTACLAGLGLVGAVTASSLLWTSSAERTVVEVARVVEYVGVLLLLLAVIRRETVGAALMGVAVSVTIVLVAALATRLAPGAFDDAARDAFGINRLSAPLNYWNGVAAWGAIATTFLLGIASSPGPRWRGVAVGLIPLAVVVTYLTYSRAGVIGTALGLLVLLAVTPRRLALLANLILGTAGAAVALLVVRGHPQIAEGTGAGGAWPVAIAVTGSGVVLAVLAVAVTARLPVLSPPSRKVQLAVGAAVVSLVVALGVAVGPSLARRAYDSFSRPAPVASADNPAARLSSLGGNRRDAFASAIAAGDSEVVHGIGGGTFELWWNREGRDREFLRDAHSLYLETYAEYGIIGSAALVLLGLLVLGTAWGARRSTADAGVSAAIAAVVVFAFHAGVDWMWELSAVTVLALTLIAVLAAACRPVAAPKSWSFPTRSLVAMAAVAAVCVQLPPSVSLSNVRESQAAVRRGDLDTARDRADDAVAASPWASSPLVQRALVSERADELPAADADLRRAAARDRFEWRIPLVRARILAKLGEPRAAIRSFEAARRLRPLSPLFRR